MPPRTRTRATKILKENIDVVEKIKPKTNGKVSKPHRKALADKTNSLSDDNASIEIPIKSSKNTMKKNTAQPLSTENKVRPRRDRRIPPRYVNNTINNLSNSKDPSKSTLETPIKSTPKDVTVDKIHTKMSMKENEVLNIRSKRSCRLQSVKENLTAKTNKRVTSADKFETSKTSLNKSSETLSPFKTPSKDLDSSLVANRPKRICGLPSKFEDHSISPNKFIPVQPIHASTPIILKGKDSKNLPKERSNNPKILSTESTKNTKTLPKESTKSSKDLPKNSTKSTKTARSNKQTSILTFTAPISKEPRTTKSNKNNQDTNNNAKTKLKQNNGNVITKLQSKRTSPNKKSPTKRFLDINHSFKILEDQPKKDNVDVYEFTFDPNEEPPPKKKKKRVYKKRPPKPKTAPTVTVVQKSKYDENVSKALEALKKKVKFVVESQPAQNVQKESNSEHNSGSTTAQTNEPQTINVPAEIAPKPGSNTDVPKTTQIVGNENFTETTQGSHPIITAIPTSPIPPLNETRDSVHQSNYASIRVEDIAADFEPSNDGDDINYSPISSPCHPKSPENESRHSIQHKDPLNLQEDPSFFDHQPVASSSMNVSIRHPTASPWRVEFGQLPIKWHSNSYVKPNMTPAVESSFIASEDVVRRKHVYTNMVPETNESLPQIVDTPNLVQSSIISFIKEVAEKSASKKKRGRSLTPVKANSLFEDVSTTTNFGYKTPKKARNDNQVATPNSNTDKDSSTESTEKRTEEKGKDKDCTYFGFDDSDQENIPRKKSNRIKGLRPRARAVLQEINNQGPTRSILPVDAKKKASSEVVNKLYEQMKSAEDAPLFPEKQVNAPNDTAVTNINEQVLDDDSQSVHLFEDIEVVHHLKPHRKSYSNKPKKVTFRQNSLSSSDESNEVEARVSDEDDDLADLTFQMPNVQEKKPTKKKSKKTKKQLTKKEEKEVEEWAACFNSMCEDIEEFPLVVE